MSDEESGSESEPLEDCAGVLVYNISNQLKLTFRLCAVLMGVDGTVVVAAVEADADKAGIDDTEKDLRRVYSMFGSDFLKCWSISSLLSL